LLLLAYSFAAGALYGLISGIVVQPGLFAVLYTGIAIIVNFIVALLVFIFNLLFLAPFKRSKRSVFKYFSVSLAFAVIFLPVIIAIAVLSTNVF
jgi:hypothetical protein